MFEWECGGQNCALQIFDWLNANTSVVELCTCTTLGSEQFVSHWVVNTSDFSFASKAYRNRNSKVRETFYKVSGAIQWVDDPLHFLIFTFDKAAFFCNDAVLRVRAFDG
ncbi:Uncharacterised protein [Vibrio cholerae]|uniref:Uncharacterized protein n=1 Tax=Vibrio cholerae TaxID=666 RepID=A0A655YYF4_VIBCL|nr:Uncharacterised protein [Vibrio cholerae]CSC52018.1 Uncharacterised protein [Vibrio cholerae]